MNIRYPIYEGVYRILTFFLPPLYFLLVLKHLSGHLMTSDDVRCHLFENQHFIQNILIHLKCQSDSLTSKR